MEPRPSHPPAAPAGPPPGLEWEGVYRAYFKPVWRFLARLGTPPGDLEDLTHEVFLTAFRRVDAFDPSRPLQPWLFGIAYRVASDYRQLARVSREDTVDVLPERPDSEDVEGAVAEKMVLARQAKAVLDEVLESMDDEKRAVFVMYELDGMTVRDIAHVVDVPLGTAYSRLRLAREQFEAGLKRRRARGAHEFVA